MCDVYQIMGVAYITHQCVGTYTADKYQTDAYQNCIILFWAYVKMFEDGHLVVQVRTDL